MSLKMSSLAFDDVQELILEEMKDFIPDLHVITSRHAQRSHGFSHTSDEVVYVTGKFSVSF